MEASDALISAISAVRLWPEEGDTPEHVTYSVSSEFAGESSVTITVTGYPDVSVEVEVQESDWDIEVDEQGCSEWLLQDDTVPQGEMGLDFRYRSHCDPPTLELARIAARVMDEPVDEARWERMTPEAARGLKFVSVGEDRALHLRVECEPWRHRESIYARRQLCPWDEMGRDEWRRRQREAR